VTIRHNIPPYCIPWLTLLLWRWNIGTVIWNIGTRPLRHWYCPLKHWYCRLKHWYPSSETLVPVLWDIGIVLWNIGTRPLKHWYPYSETFVLSYETLALSSETLIPTCIIWNWQMSSETLVPTHWPTCRHILSKASSPLNLTHNPEDFKVTHILKSRKSSFPAAGNDLLQAPYASSWFTEFWKDSSIRINLRTFSPVRVVSNLECKANNCMETVVCVCGTLLWRQVTGLDVTTRF
jgi:hypothetical protein